MTYVDFKNLKLFPIYNFFLFFLFKISEEQFDLPFFFLNTQDDKRSTTVDHVCEVL